MRISIFLCPLFLGLFFCNLAWSAANYDKFYDNDATFREMDKRLNEVYKNVNKKLDWGAHNSLMIEQRYWHDKLFPLLVDEAGEDSASAARAVLENRVANLEKLENADAASDILGMAIKFGMTENEVAQKLGLKDNTLLDASAGDVNTYKIKLFGYVAPVYFTFMHTTFSNSQPEAKSDFARFAKALAAALGVPETDIAAPDPTHLNLTTLVSLTVSDLESRKDFDTLNEFLAKKYKTAYPAAIATRILLNEKYDILGNAEAEDLALSSTDRFYEDQERYIFASGSWGNVSGSFNVSYFSHPYLDLHIYNLPALVASLGVVTRFNNSLGILPEGANLEDVIYAIGGRDIAFFDNAGDYYSLQAQFRGPQNLKGSLEIYMTPANEAFALTFSYVLEDFPDNFENVIKDRIAKRYQTLKTTPDGVMRLLGAASNDDSDFETENNYIHFGFTPHFAVEHNFSIINKKELGKFMHAYDARQERHREAEEKRQEQVQEDVEKF